jgi:hypothetical protein
MGKHPPKTDPRDRTRPDAGETPTPVGAARTPGAQAGNIMDKDGNYTWTPAQERKRSDARRLAAVV